MLVLCVASAYNVFGINVAADRVAARNVAAKRLRDRGFCVIDEPLLDRACINQLASASGQRLSQLLDEVESTGYDPIEQSYHFAEVSHRQRQRWDMRPPPCEHWQLLCDRALQAATPIIRDALAMPDESPTLVMSGVVVSRPGCTAQGFHADATESHQQQAATSPHHRLYTAFVPLVDVRADGTQFWVGSHHGDVQAHARRSTTRDGRLRVPAESAPLEAPACRAGGMILFDYRVLHRGLPNAGRERPIAYCVCAMGGAWDNANFPQTSLADGTAHHYVDHTPFWEDAIDEPAGDAISDLA